MFATKHQQCERAASAAPQTLDQSENARHPELQLSKNKTTKNNNKKNQNGIDSRKAGWECVVRVLSALRWAGGTKINKVRQTRQLLSKLLSQKIGATGTDGFSS